LLAVGLVLVAPAIAADKIFNVPKQHNIRIDHCAGNVGPCGQPVADAFCVGNGFLRSAKFSVSESTASTVYLNSTAKCTRRQCLPFDRIACTDAPNFGATIDTDIGTVKP